jgi:hypothetical protein
MGIKETFFTETDWVFVALSLEDGTIPTASAARHHDPKMMTICLEFFLFFWRGPVQTTLTRSLWSV